MINRQKIYQLIDNKYENYKIEISAYDLLIEDNITENNYIDLYIKYINLLYNALIYNYKNYNYAIKKIKFIIHFHMDISLNKHELLKTQLLNKQFYTIKYYIKK